MAIKERYESLKTQKLEIIVVIMKKEISKKGQDEISAVVRETNETFRSGLRVRKGWEPVLEHIS